MQYNHKIKRIIFFISCKYFVFYITNKQLKNKKQNQSSRL